MDRERFKGNNRDAFIDSHDYEMLLQDNDEVSLKKQFEMDIIVSGSESVFPKDHFRLVRQNP